MGFTRYAPVADAPVDLDVVLREHPTVRQSLLSAFDECHLRALHEVQHNGPWNNGAQALGIMFHRVAAEIILTLQRVNEQQIPTQEAVEIMEECVEQRGIDPDQYVHLDLRQKAELRALTIKFASDNKFSIERVVGVEEPLAMDVQYMTDGGEIVTRKLTGTLDLLLFDPPDGAIVVDWKSGWGLPPEPRDPEAPKDDVDRISYEGYFQQRYYGALVLVNFPAVKRVTLREFYPRWTQVRRATMTREDLGQTLRDFGDLVRRFDEAMVAGALSPKWKPSPGKHCSFCMKPGACPIEEEARSEGAITDQETAERYAAERIVAEEVRKHRTTAAKSWVEAHGPIAVKNAKGRSVLGWNVSPTSGKRRFEVFVPDESDRGGEVPVVDNPEVKTGV
jgi:hypothetical protein